ncbi:glycosyl hydrolase family 65 protein [Sphingomonas sp. DG1-23]|uniref:glycoside hydrolase family 65 protein n=1 Tax=Sphingomonas sp. DG1-23 TaxID=3068316 RepID=UPI00273DBBCE|nr:glycosyl hydrolase family 65 protein [Sphingomonas sp. DG1-23]MDP5278245.1 glycosyl hydrolase family 65 protein [Sphingomonas sp. DG1-23]
MGGAERGRQQDLTFTDDGWTLVIAGDDADRAGWAGTILALSNGTIGVRGVIEERAHASTFLAEAFEQSPIHYHERLHGFAETSDTRVPVAEPLGLRVLLDGAPVDFASAHLVETRRALDLRTGLLRRRSHWVLADGRAVTIHAERLVPIQGTPLLLRRLRVEAEGVARLEPFLAAAPRAVGQSDDPRIGVQLASGGFATEQAEESLVVERLPGSGIGVAAVQRTRIEDDWLVVASGYAVGVATSDALRAEAQDRVDAAIAAGFDAALAAQHAAFGAFWERADVRIEGDPDASAALRVNLFHLFASAGRDGRSSAAAKGLTGEGYEGHYFWDTEAFMLPVLALVAPEVARAMLVYRFRTLDAARANARALDHRSGALYAWRTIAGRECSAHYPSGSAQYHINAAIGFAIGFYADATGDQAFLFEMGAEMLIETARLWLALGDWRSDGFHIHGVTGPDEYTALVDDNWYTNRMAQKHLRLARKVADQMAAAAPADWVILSRKLAVRESELERFTRAADAMHLPYDSALDLDAQDASFLSKPRWDLAGTPGDRFPLLLHYHPMTLYRHQVCKQADLVLGMVLGGEDVPQARKRRAFDYYEPITTHDSTLSASSFAILASEVGHDDAALRFFRDASFVDIEDQHGNTDHGVHMASLAGSWLALVWGFAGFRPGENGFGFRPKLPAAWNGYRFGMRWRGSELRVAVTGEGARYEIVAGPALSLAHNGEDIRIAPGESWTGPLAQ